MARNDGIDRTLARNQDLETPDDVTKVQEHNEREKDRYSNVDIVPERTALNVPMPIKPPWRSWAVSSISSPL